MTHSVTNSVVKPGVVDDKTLDDHISQPKRDCETLKLDFLNITKIQHLWMFKSLKKLSLTHNRIETIENLNELANLKELDLSFNSIQKIENVEKLKNVEVLMLNNNRIKRLENMDNLTNLTIFGISGNIITEYREFVYLRNFQRLRALSVHNNLCDGPECESFLKAVLPVVKYINYKLVTSEEKMKYATEFDNLLKQVKEKEQSLEETIRDRKKMEIENELDEHSFVEFLSNSELFDTMFEQDKSTFTFLNSSQELMKDYQEYKFSNEEIMKKFVEFGHKQYHNRINEIKQFKNGLYIARSKCAEKNRRAITKFLEIKSDAFKSITCVTQNMNYDSNSTHIQAKIDDLCKLLKISIENLWKELMTEEITLQEQYEDTKKYFESNIQEFSHQMIDMAKIVFNEWREKEIEWQFNFQTHLDKLLKKKYEIKPTPELECISFNENFIVEGTKQSANEHIQFINDREELLMARVQKWTNELIHKMYWIEIRQSRKKILEITHLIEKYQVEVEKKQRTFQNNENI